MPANAALFEYPGDLDVIADVRVVIVHFLNGAEFRKGPSLVA